MVSLREKTRMHVSETSSILSIYTPDSTYAEPERRELSPYNQTKTKENETKETELALETMKSKLQEFQSHLLDYDGRSSRYHSIHNSSQCIHRDLCKLRDRLTDNRFNCQIDCFSSKHWNVYKDIVTLQHLFVLMEKVKSILNANILSIKKKQSISEAEKSKLLRVQRIIEFIKAGDHLRKNVFATLAKDVSQIENCLKQILLQSASLDKHPLKTFRIRQSVLQSLKCPMYSLIIPQYQ
ncbi:hypothetical protein GJ496_000249 [Pomphorhynchus laevis]|nr:hypothetical protein GJ496_000249 [Pomphorhynchus laevis]